MRAVFAPACVGTMLAFASCHRDPRDRITAAPEKDRSRWLPHEQTHQCDA